MTATRCKFLQLQLHKLFPYISYQTASGKNFNNSVPLKHFHSTAATRIPFRFQSHDSFPWTSVYFRKKQIQINKISLRLLSFSIVSCQKNHYDTLGVGRQDSVSTIKKAYYVLAKKYHPDTSTDPGSNDRFREVQEAYEVLSDETKKAEYDRQNSFSSGSWERNKTASETYSGQSMHEWWYHQNEHWYSKGNYQKQKTGAYSFYTDDDWFEDGWFEHGEKDRKTWDNYWKYHTYDFDGRKMYKKRSRRSQQSPFKKQKQKNKSSGRKGSHEQKSKQSQKTNNENDEEESKKSKKKRKSQNRTEKKQQNRWEEDAFRTDTNAKKEKKKGKMTGIEKQRITVFLSWQFAARGGVKDVATIDVWNTCKRCNGGQEDQDRNYCRACEGRGVFEEEQTISIIVPKGTYHGQRMQFEWKLGGEKGVLLVKFAVKRRMSM